MPRDVGNGGPSRALRPALLSGAALLLVATIALLAAPSLAVDPPFAIINEPDTNTTWEAGFPIRFNASDSTDPDQAGPLYYTWTFPDETIGGTGVAVVVYSNFTIPGYYIVRLNVRDVEALESNATVAVYIVPFNPPPTALIASPTIGSRYFTDEFVRFSATGSSDPEGEGLTYFWSEGGSPRGSGENVSIFMPAGDHNVTLEAVDDRGKRDFASVLVHIEVNVAPAVAAAAVSPATGFDGDTFVFRASYSDGNGEPAATFVLVLDGSPHDMALSPGGDPRAGQNYTLSLPLGPGRHAFYALATDGNLTNLTATVAAPDVYENLTVVSADGLATLEVAVLPPYAFNISAWQDALPADPTGLVPVSLPYFVNASALAGSNFTLTVAFTPAALVNASSALLHRMQASDWLSLVSVTQAAAHTARVQGDFADLPGVFRTFAARASPPANAPPSLAIAYAAHAGEFYPNSTITFDASGSSDPENGTLLYAWRFKGPSLATAWIPGRNVSVTFPEAGVYAVELQADDGSGRLAQKNITLEIRNPPIVPVNTLEEPVALAGLAVAVALSGAIAVWWRGRAPKRKRAYEDQYGRLYSQGPAEDAEYAQLFEKFAEPDGEAPPQVESDPAARR